MNLLGQYTLLSYYLFNFFQLQWAYQLNLINVYSWLVCLEFDMVIIIWFVIQRSSLWYTKKNLCKMHYLKCNPYNSFLKYIFFNLQTLLFVIQYNDNNGNPYSDVFWLAAMVQSVGELEFERQVFSFPSMHYASSLVIIFYYVELIRFYDCPNINKI